MERRWPILVKVRSLLHVGITQCTHVIRQGINPHIHDMIIIPRNRHAPIKRRSTNTQISQPSLDKRNNLILPRLWRNKIRMRLVILKQLIFILAQLEKVRIFLLQPLNLRTSRCLAIHQLALIIITLIPHRIPSLITPQINSILLHKRLPQMLHRLLMMRLRSPNKIIIANIQQSQQIPKRLGHLIAKSLRFHARVPGGSFHLFAVFVRPA
mmetsp:Transcript_25233/g.54351  ORF Transcript_25233/g.54351 Transcript_25233/m.54351 type:complete len:211 (-) Transcript_25233:520-1152(-)